MSIRGLQAWAVRNRDFQGSARALGSEINRNGQGNFRRIFMWDFPIFHKVSRMDWERQLFNLTMRDHVKHEHKSNSWFKVLGFFIPLAIFLTVFLAFPPKVLRKQPFYAKVTLWKETNLARMETARLGYKSQYKIPEKVWVNGGKPFIAHWQRILEGRGDMVAARRVDETQNILQQLAEIERRAKAAGALDTTVGPGDAIVLVLRGVARTDGGEPLSEHGVVWSGSLITTDAKSFVKLMYPDFTMLSVGPGSTVKLLRSPHSPVNLVELHDGSLRAKVSMPEKTEGTNIPKEKFQVRTKLALLGGSGADFYVSHSDKEVTSLVTFEGAVAIRTIKDSFSLDSERGLRLVGPEMLAEARPEQYGINPPIKLIENQLAILRSKSEISGADEARTQDQNLKSAQDRLRAQAAHSGNSSSALYQEMVPDAQQVSRALASTAGYEQVSTVPARLQADIAQFPDLP
ncbi:MAG TPA: FecR family protein [Bdellovibrionota bacterium]|jgi:hypothetical protein